MEQEIAMLQKEREHKDKLPGVKLPEDMAFTTDLKAAGSCSDNNCRRNASSHFFRMGRAGKHRHFGKDVLVLAVPSPYTRATSKSMALYVKLMPKIPICPSATISMMNPA